MKTKMLSNLSYTEVTSLIEKIPFLKDLCFNDFNQYQLLLGHSKLILLEPGETLLRKGEKGKNIYFLASGHLDVFSEEGPREKALNQLASGEIIGALSIINDQPRTATLAASRSYSSEKTSVIATDFRIFGKNHDFSKIKLSTKSHLLNLVINNTRFKLNTYQKQFPDHRLTQQCHQVGVYDGEAGTAEELNSLSGQAFAYTMLLNNWNRELESSFDVPQIEQPRLNTKEKLLSFFYKKKVA